jgi:hypothetical protein
MMSVARYFYFCVESGGNYFENDNVFLGIDTVVDSLVDTNIPGKHTVSILWAEGGDSVLSVNYWFLLMSLQGAKSQKNMIIFTTMKTSDFTYVENDALMSSLFWFC